MVAMTSLTDLCFIVCITAQMTVNNKPKPKCPLSDAMDATSLYFCVVYGFMGRGISLTCKKMEHSHTQGRGEAAAQAGADTNQAAEEHQGQRHQGQKKLASPEICNNNRINLNLMQKHYFKE